MSDEEKSIEDPKLEGSKPKETPLEIEKAIKVYKLNVSSEEFEELESINEQNLKDLLDSKDILIFADSDNSRVWIWEGAHTTPKMKFISARRAPIIRDSCGIDFSIATIDDGDEPEEFKSILGL
ncbi:MAG: hypothetical protein EU539_08585 [Promethearchaeota archaeon]|nr:MAG: hypothetical protein EU539_08585 [Candidatus Lokiarchaeota archaeon]